MKPQVDVALAHWKSTFMLFGTALTREGRSRTGHAGRRVRAQEGERGFRRHSNVAASRGAGLE
jgi:hypothetical protein